MPQPGGAGDDPVSHNDPVDSLADSGFAGRAVSAESAAFVICKLQILNTVIVNS